MASKDNIGALERAETPEILALRGESTKGGAAQARRNSSWLLNNEE